MILMIWFIWISIVKIQTTATFYAVFENIDTERICILENIPHNNANTKMLNIKKETAVLWKMGKLGNRVTGNSGVLLPIQDEALAFKR